MVSVRQFPPESPLHEAGLVGKQRASADAISAVEQVQEVGLEGMANSERKHHGQRRTALGWRTVEDLVEVISIPASWWRLKLQEPHLTGPRACLWDW